MSVKMFAAAMLGPRLAAGFAPKRMAQAGLLALALTSVFLLGTIDVELNESVFAVALAVFGVGAGLLLSQLGNVIMSSVDSAKTNEAGGLQGTAPIVPVEDIEQAAREEGLPAEQAKALADDYGDAQLHGLKRSIGAIAIFALLSLWFTRRLPGTRFKRPDQLTRPHAGARRAPPAHA
jgi:hypothetical protein